MDNRDLIRDVKLKNGFKVVTVRDRNSDNVAILRLKVGYPYNSDNILVDRDDFGLDDSELERMFM